MTKQEAMSVKVNQLLHHVHGKLPNGQPMSCRVSGLVGSVKRSETYFELPVRSGVSQFVIVPANAHEWVVADAAN